VRRGRKDWGSAEGAAHRTFRGKGEERMINRAWAPFREKAFINQKGPTPRKNTMRRADTGEKGNAKNIVAGSSSQVEGRGKEKNIPEEGRIGRTSCLGKPSTLKEREKKAFAASFEGGE